MLAASNSLVLKVRRCTKGAVFLWVLLNEGLGEKGVRFATSSCRNLHKAVVVLTPAVLMLHAGNTYFGVVGPCGGHANDYHFHKSFSCLYAQSGGHSTKVGDVASHGIYGKWEDYDLKRLPLLDACGAHIGPTPDSSTPVYHYHVQDQAPFTVGCHGPSQSGGLVSVAVCRSLYTDCDNDGGSGTTITTKTGNVQYDRFCPCFDASGSNMGGNIQELPALSSSEIHYDAGANATDTILPDTGSSVNTGDVSLSMKLCGHFLSMLSILFFLTC